MPTRTQYCFTCKTEVVSSETDGVFLCPTCGEKLPEVSSELPAQEAEQTGRPANFWMILLLPLGLGLFSAVVSIVSPEAGLIFLIVTFVSTIMCAVASASNFVDHQGHKGFKRVSLTFLYTIFMEVAYIGILFAGCSAILSLHR